MRLALAGGEGVSTKRVRVERGIYRQPNGKYAVCIMLEGKPRFRTVGYDLELARKERETLSRAASYGVLACAPRLCFAKLAGWWLERYERKVAVGRMLVRSAEAAGDEGLICERWQIEAGLLA
jgi:hypothetical protein